MASRSKRDSNLDWRRVASGPSIAAVGAARSVPSISAWRWIIRIGRSTAAAGARHSIAAVAAAGAAAAGEIRCEFKVVAHRYIELRRGDIGMARGRDADMPQLAVADPRIGRKRNNAFLVNLDNRCSHLEVFPKNLALAPPSATPCHSVEQTPPPEATSLLARRPVLSAGSPAST